MAVASNLLTLKLSVPSKLPEPRLNIVFILTLLNSIMVTHILYIMYAYDWLIQGFSQAVQRPVLLSCVTR